MFGAVTYMPLYLQVVKGVAPSTAGLQLTPMMAGMLVTSITSGRIISRIGRYRAFPIIGTAIGRVGLALLSTLDAGTSTWAASGYMLVLGLGLGMVMQVLVLAVQNAVDYADLGVATSGTTLFRSIGGSVGVSAFGAIFTAGLAAHLAGALPNGENLPSAIEPAAIQALPAALRAIYANAFTAALHPVFLTAAVHRGGRLRAGMVSRRRAAARPGARRDDRRKLRDAARRHLPGGTRTDRRPAATPREPLAGLPNDRRGGRRRARADEIWLLARLCRAGQPVSEEPALGRDRFAEIGQKLAAKDMARRVAGGALAPSPRGRDAFECMVAVRRARLAQLLECWAPEQHAEVRAMLDRLAQTLMADPPAMPDAGTLTRRQARAAGSSA